MKILRVIASLEATDGGPTTAAHATSRALARAGAEVVQITTVSDADPRPGDGRPVVDGGVTYRFFRRSLPGRYKYSRGMGRFLRDHVADFDVVHVEGLFLYPTLASCRRAWRAGVPYLLAPLGALNAWSIRHRAWKKMPYLALLERTHLRRAVALPANSESEVDALRAIGFGATARLVPLGVEPPSPPPARRRADGSLRLLYLSRLHAVKGIPLLLEAVAALRRQGADVTLTIAGSGEPAYERTLHALVESLGIAPVVRFVGHVDGAAKDALLREADVFALTSYQESFGLAVAEAMSYGLPLLVTDRVGIAGEINEAGAGLVVAPEAAQVERALARLVADEPGRAEMGRRGERLVRERFSWDDTARALLSLYEDAARSRPRAALAPEAALAR